MISQNEDSGREGKSPPDAGKNLTADGEHENFIVETIVQAEQEGLRLDSFLAAESEFLSRSRAQKLIISEQVLVNREVCLDKNYRLTRGDRVEAALPPPEKSPLQAENIVLEVIYEDCDLMVVNKPRGMVVHPSPGHPGGTLVNALLYRCSDLSGIGGITRPGIVHRLDRDTSGLLIVAKNDAAHRHLSNQLKNRTLKRQYIALACGRVKPVAGRIEAPIRRHPRHRKKMSVQPGGRAAVTLYRVQKYFGPYSLLELSLETGRTHQVRVHLAHLGFPVVGDPTYARPARFSKLPPFLASPQALHARRIRFVHPRTRENMEFTAPPPSEFKAGLRWLHSKF